MHDCPPPLPQNRGASRELWTMKTIRLASVGNTVTASRDTARAEMLFLAISRASVRCCLPSTREPSDSRCVLHVLSLGRRHRAGQSAFIIRDIAACAITTSTAAARATLTAPAIQNSGFALNTTDGRSNADPVRPLLESDGDGYTNHSRSRTRSHYGNTPTFPGLKTANTNLTSERAVARRNSELPHAGGRR